MDKLKKATDLHLENSTEVRYYIFIRFNRIPSWLRFKLKRAHGVEKMLLKQTRAA